ncbi:MAG: nuclear transport factor 2 family protein [Acidobacteriota bacterium]|nr:nuclear transport factor 2 family protein [Acidobacteriota bacterium]
MTEQENLRIVQEGYAAFGRGDVAAALSNYADDVDWAMPGSPDIFPYAGQRRGREQVAQFYSTFAQTEDVEQMDLQDFIAQGDKVLVFGHYKGRVKSTGRSYTKDFIHAVTLRAGKVVKFREYVASDDMYEAFAGKS